MSRYEYDPSKAQSTIEVLEKGDYEFVIGEPKSFIRKNRKGQDSYGIRFPLTADGKTKPVYYTCYLHSEGAQGMTKRFQMAAMGYKNSKVMEQAFDGDVIGMDWSYDPETGAVGDAWRKFTGKRVVGTVDIGANEETGEPQQVWKSWRPVE